MTTTHLRRGLASAAVVLAAALTGAGCGSSGHATSSQAAAPAAQVKPPGAIKQAGKLVYCTSLDYPPLESSKGSQPVGADIDIGKAIGRLMGASAEFDNTGYDGIIAALQASKCDALIAGLNDTAQRRAQVNFVDYIAIGQSLMVQKGNPKHITKLSDLSGHSVAVQVGSTNRAFLEAANKKLAASGTHAMNIVTFPNAIDAVNALKSGQTDAFFGDTPVVILYTRQDPALATGGSPINPIPTGIAVRKNDPTLRTAVQQAVDKLYASGEIKQILAKWSMSSAALAK